jgi:nucleoid-associated protein YgaU
MVIRLPKVEDSSPKPVQRTSDHPKNTPAKQPEKQAKKPAAQSSAPAAAFTWYQVRKNERYASIARNVFGDPNRWREIHELNKDRFPNPDQIREGVRIRIPTRGRK